MKNEVYDHHKSSIADFDANIVALLAYLIPTVLAFAMYVRFAAWLVPIVVFFLEKESKFVKFHAMQSFLINVIGAVIGIITKLIAALVIAMGSSSIAMFFGIAFSLIATLILIGLFVLDILAMIGAYNYKEVHIPIIGNISSNFSSK